MTSTDRVGSFHGPPDDGHESVDVVQQNGLTARTSRAIFHVLVLMVGLDVYGAHAGDVVFGNSDGTAQRQLLYHPASRT